MVLGASTGLPLTDADDAAGQHDRSGHSRRGQLGGERACEPVLLRRRLIAGRIALLVCPGKDDGVVQHFWLL
jgi:hypothetical protein